MKEIDLHIQSLLENTNEMLPKEILEYQLNVFRKELDDAISKRYYKITFIHGIGQGSLKDEIWKLLKNKSGIVFFEAPYKEYGRGATEINIL